MVFHYTVVNAEIWNVISSAECNKVVSEWISKYGFIGTFCTIFESYNPFSFQNINEPLWWCFCILQSEKAFNIHNNQTINVKCWKKQNKTKQNKKKRKRKKKKKRKKKSSGSWISFFRRDCRTNYSNTSFWSPYKVKSWDPYEPSMHGRKCRIDELTGFMLYYF